MAPRAYWKGFLRLSLVTCPIALFPATSESEKISFNQINRNTGHRIKYQKVDADTGQEVSNEDIIKGYKVDTDQYLEVSKEELENISLESTRTIEIDEFVPRKEIDDLYLRSRSRSGRRANYPSAAEPPIEASKPFFTTTLCELLGRNFDRDGRSRFTGATI